MNYKKPTYITFFTLAFISLLVALLFEKMYQLYIQPLTIIAIFMIYITEKKAPISITYILALIFSLSGAILLILGYKEYIPEASILFSLFYVMYLRLMYLKNKKKKTTVKMYFILVIISLPIVYIYDRVICLIYNEIRGDFIYFTVLVFFIFAYIITAIYYYLRNKNQSNLWMLIAAVNLGIMNIIIMINQLYIYDVMFTVITLFCSYLMYYFSLKFMLEDDENNVSDLIV
ncbi:hypothetical protein H2O64_15895 [Kordia sp. YSTF-M3]|uniref:YhhN-like protein n=2 Tax=Kordia aestuariivivens TaxID=2759037 RepID=A0ABR7QC86_9FLAO|nr:hypothetical protein [Kordia aestuariivivens]